MISKQEKLLEKAKGGLMDLGLFTNPKIERDPLVTPQSDLAFCFHRQPF